MSKALPVAWSARSLRNAKEIRTYIFQSFGKEAVITFDDLLQNFEKSVSRFPLLFVASQKHPHLRRAVMNPQLIVIYQIKDEKIAVVALQDTRQNQASK
jgi:plasmid stabilization system protein ParE